MTERAFAHQGARLTVNVSAIIHNWHYFQFLHPNAETSAVVKADAYGLGIMPVANALRAAGCHSYFVATLAEALELRSTIGDREIFVLNGLRPGQEQDFIQNGITPCLNDLNQISRWQKMAKRLSRPVPSVIHMDSGMNRLGLEAREREKLMDDWSLLEGLDLRIFMSHLACADEVGHPLNDQQFRAFSAMRDRLPKVRFSLSASSGALMGPQWGFDLIRPGIALYGGIDGAALQHVIRLEAQILQIRSVQQGEHIGYGATFTAKRPSRIATLDLGYADGYLRMSSNHGYITIAGHRAPIVGRVSMDMIAADVTDIPENKVKRFDYVDILGADRKISTVAQDAQTIPYEILTSLGKRYQRRYVTDQ